MALNTYIVKYLNPDGSTDCPRCNQHIDPHDVSNETYTLVDFENFHEKPVGFKVTVQCNCGQLIQIEVK